MMNRYRITKIGLLNFWLYDEEEYDFYGGKLILRGTNGSGKSVTMQSFIPLILDGNKSPDRLDPFGSKERKIEDYIIGDSESFQKEEATSYLYMENYCEDENKYLTIGLGFRGRKGKPVESWGFALKDGKRIGKDFYLYKDVANKIPLSKNELKSRLGSINEFTDTTKDYKKMVNRLLFGFPNLDTYDEFIKILLQLRSNKLSKDYKPTNLINVLNTVLQPLTEEDLRPLYEVIEQMNKTKEQIETLEKNSKSLKDFLRVYRNYNEILLLTKARKYKKRLDNKDLKDKIESLSSINETIKKLESKLKELETSIDNCERDKLDLNSKISSVEIDIYKLKKSIGEVCVDLKDMAQDTYFDELIFFTDELMENMENASLFDSIFMSLNRYKDKVSIIKNLLEEERKIMLESETTRVELEKLSNTYKTLEKDISLFEDKLKEAIMAWEEDFVNRINNNSHLKLDDFTKTKIFEIMNGYTP